MSQAKGQPRHNRRRWKFYIHPFQKRYAVWLALLLFVSSLVVFGLAFLAHYATPVSKLVSPRSLEERQIASQQFIALAETGGPALVVLVVGAVLFSLYVTHRLAGPLYRLEQSVREVAQGNVSLRIRFRGDDELHGLAAAANEALTTMDKALSEIRTRQASGSVALRQTVDRLQAAHPPDTELLAQVQLALDEGERIESVIKKFRLSDSV